MSLEMITWAMRVGRERKLSTGKRLVLIHLGEKAWADTHVAITSYDELSDATGVGNRSLTTHLQSFVDEGLMRRARLRRKDGTLAGYAFWLDAPARADWPGKIQSLQADFSIAEDGVEQPAAKFAGGVNQPQIEIANCGAIPGNNHNPSSYPSDMNPSLEKKGRKRKRRFRVCQGLQEMRELFPVDRRAGLTAEGQQDLYDELVEEFGRDALVAACRRYLAKKGEYVTHFGRFLRDDVENWLPKPMSEDDWRKACTMHRDKGWWSDHLGPPPLREGCRVPPAILLEAFGPHSSGAAVNGAAH